MAFSCKVPLSRRQIWEKTTGLSQFGGLKQQPKINAQQRELDELDTTVFSQIATAAAPPSKKTDFFDLSAKENKAVVLLTVSRSPSTEPHIHAGSSSSLNFADPESSEKQQQSLEIRSAAKGELPHHHSSANQQKQQRTKFSHVIHLPEKINFSKVDVLFICFSIILYIADIGLDCSIAYKHYLAIEEEPLYFGFTVAFILLAGVVTSVFSLWWYYFEYKLKKLKAPKDIPTKKGFIIRIVACSLTLGPIVRYVDTIAYGLRSRNKGHSSELRQYYHNEMQFQRADGAMLRLFEAFLESAPQFLLQVFIVLRRGLDGEREGNYFLVSITIASIASSVVSLSWSVVAYHKALRMSRHDVKDIEHFGLAFRFIWRLFEISPRIVILAMFMSAFGFYLGIFAAVHYVLMVTWLYKLHTDFCEKPRCEILFVTVMGLIWCFCFFNLKDGHTRRTSLLFYTLFFAENIGLALGWLYKTHDEDIWFRHIVLPIVLGSMVPMIAAMLIYYKVLHREDIKTCLPWSYWNPCAHGVDLSPPVRYRKTDGSGIERQRLTQQIKKDTQPLPEVPKEAVDPVDVEVVDDEGITDCSMPTYRAPTPSRFDSEAEASDKCDDETAPNLDDCIEVNGYLESSVLAKRSIKLTRQDTIPKYIAPVPSHYGATVPGGAPAQFNISIIKPTSDPSHGSTLPGAPSIATVVNNNERFVPYEETVSNSPVSHRTLDKPPLPTPRLSIHHDDCQPTAGDRIKSQSKSSLHDESNLTTISELSGDQSRLFDRTLSPSPSRPISNHDSGRLDESVSDITFSRCSTAEAIRADDTTSNTSSVDTPLKAGGTFHAKLDLSIDTPVKETRKSQTS